MALVARPAERDHAGTTDRKGGWVQERTWRVALADRDANVVAALQSVVDAEPDLVVVGTARSLADLMVVVRTTTPDVVVIEARLDVKVLSAMVFPDTPRMLKIVLSVVATPSVAARVAVLGYDAVIDKADTDALLAAIRSAG